MSSASDIDEEDGGGFALADLVGAIRSRWLLIVACTVAFGALAVAVAMSLPSQYEASATIQIDPRKKTIVNVENVVADLRPDQSTVESEVEILHSKALSLRVIETLGLRQNPDFVKPSLWRRLTDHIGFARADRGAVERHIEAMDGVVVGSAPKPSEYGPQRDQILADFEKRVKVARVRNSLLIEVKSTAGDPALSARIANTLVETYLQEQIASKVRATAETTELLQQKLEVLRQKLNDAERNIATFKGDNRIFDSEGHLLSEKQLARLMEQTVLARNVTAEAKAKYDQVQELLRRGLKTAIGDVLQNHTIRLFRDQHLKATRREAELMAKYGAHHPELQKARAEVADVNAQITGEVDRILASLDTEYRVAVGRERGLEASLAALKDQQVDSRDAAVKLRELEREAASSRQVFESFLARYKQTAETQDLQVADSRIVERADVPLSVSSPKRGRIVGLGAFAGLGLGFCLALLLEMMRPGLTRPEEIQELLGVPHLASVPLLRRRSDGLGNPDEASRAVVVVPDGPFARSVRNGRHAIDMRRPGPEPRIILVTSALPNEGKTLLAASLAYQYATNGVRTLLIDADLRRSTLTRQMGHDNLPGLLDAIMGGKAFEGYLMTDETTGLTVLPAGGTGRVSISAAEALSAPGIGQRLGRLKTHFDTIIIDAPPLLPVIDARILADDADQVVLVTSWGRTARQLVRRAINLLGSNGQKIVGVLINKVDVQSHAKTYGESRRANRSRSRAA